MKSKVSMKETFLVTLIAGMIVHIFAITNILQNYDTLVMTPKGYGTASTSGRWFLDILGKYLYKFLFGNAAVNVPYFNITFSIVILSLAAALIVQILCVKKRMIAWLVGIIFISFPTVVSNLAFNFTCQYYSIAILLAVLAVYLNEKFSKIGWIGTILCLILSLGIYQAFYPLAVMLFLELAIKKILDEEYEIKRTIREGIKSILLLIISVFGYIVIAKTYLHFTGEGLSDYKGVNEMGQIGLDEIPVILYRIYLNIGLIFKNNYFGVNETSVLKHIIALLFVLSAMMIIAILIKRKSLMRGIFALVGCALLPLAFGFIEIMCQQGIYTLMVYSTIGIFLMPVVLFDLFEGTCFFEKEKLKRCADKTKKCVCYFLIVALMMVSINYIWLANGNYVVMHYTQEQTVNYLNLLYSNIRSTEGYHIGMPIAFIGKPGDGVDYSNFWDFEGSPFNYGGISERLLGTYGQYMEEWLYIGIPPQGQIYGEKLEELKQLEVVYNMPLYPNDGSIIIYDDIIIVKFSWE